jgi:hypothetical protein
MLHPLQTQYDALAEYTLAHHSPEFLHQHLVDCFTLQTAQADTKPIGVVFSLVGVCLASEYGFNGKEVQSAHIQLARIKTQYPQLALPDFRGATTIADILNVAPGASRDAALRAWCKDVWQFCAEHHDMIRTLLRTRGIVKG